MNKRIVRGEGILLFFDFYLLIPLCGVLTYCVHITTPEEGLLCRCTKKTCYIDVLSSYLLKTELGTMKKWGFIAGRQLPLYNVCICIPTIFTIAFVLLFQSTEQKPISAENFSKSASVAYLM